MKISDLFIGILVLILGLALSSASCGGEAPPKLKDSVIVTIDTVYETVKAPDLNTPQGLATLDKLQVMAGDSLVTLTQSEIFQTAEGLTGFPYIPSRVQDCSGMFTRYIRALRSATVDFEIPDGEVATEDLITANQQGRLKFRDTGGLAKWYHDRELLVVVPRDSADSKVYQDMIKPGMVMFYGQNKIPYKNPTPEELFVRGTGIQHIGVVVEVRQNEETGEIERYRLFHGRNSKKVNGVLVNPSAITAEVDPNTGKIKQDWLHKRDFSNDTGSSRKYPTLGYANQQWVAIAPITSDLYTLEAKNC